MKKVVSLLVLLFAQFSFASIIVEGADQVQHVKYSSPLVTGGPIVTSTTFKVTYESCAPVPSESFEVVVGSTTFGLTGGEEKTISIQLKSDVRDCFGPTFPRSYSVTTEDIEQGERYILLNPSLLNLSPFVAY